METRKKSFQVGDMVFAKVRGHPAWPAKIYSIEEKSNVIKYNVRFFGAEETASVSQKKLSLYSESKDKYGKPNKRKGFNKGISALEKELKKISKRKPKVLSLSYEWQRLIEIKKARSMLEEAEESENKGSITENSLKRKHESKVDENPVKQKKKLSSDIKVTIKESSKTINEQRSRSGRVIKPRKYLYEEIEAEMVMKKLQRKYYSENKDISSSKKLNKQNKKEEKESEDINFHENMGRLMWVRAPTGEMVQLKLDQGRPLQFKDEKVRKVWEKANEMNAIRLKCLIEKGEFLPNDIKRQMKLTPEEEKELSQEQIERKKTVRVLERQRGKFRWLKVETRLVEVNSLVKKSLQKSESDVDKALTLLDELINLPLDALMLKKHPEIVFTTQKLRLYVGNTKCWNLTTEEETKFAREAEKIREKAEIALEKFRHLFGVSEEGDFFEYFSVSLKQFNQLTAHMTINEILSLIIDPSREEYIDVLESEKDAQFKFISIEKETKNSCQ